MSEIKDKFFEEISFGQEKARLEKDLIDDKVIIKCINIGKYLKILYSNKLNLTKEGTDWSINRTIDKIHSANKYNLSKEDISSVVLTLKNSK
jgi:hypothetical protein